MMGRKGEPVMADAETTLATLKDAVRLFGTERAWEPFHSPKNLTMGLAVETAELMEHFLWLECEASREVVKDPAKKQAIADELADVAAYVLNLSNVLDIDLSEALANKLVKNALKYPVEEYRGRFSR